MEGMSEMWEKVTTVTNGRRGWKREIWRERVRVCS